MTCQYLFHKTAPSMSFLARIISSARIILLSAVKVRCIVGSHVTWMHFRERFNRCAHEFSLDTLVRIISRDLYSEIQRHCRPPCYSSFTLTTSWNIELDHRAQLFFKWDCSLTILRTLALLVATNISYHNSKCVKHFSHVPFIHIKIGIDLNYCIELITFLTEKKLSLLFGLYYTGMKIFPDCQKTAFSFFFSYSVLCRNIRLS